MSSRNRYLIVSDLHLADVEDNPDGWKYYKSSRFLIDDEFDRLVTRFLEEKLPDSECGGTPAPLTMIFNGDIFDFDLITVVPDNPPWPVSKLE
ncbi:MAG: hypothetical protein WC889_19595, partial [Myxococcota bacterium]